MRLAGERLPGATWIRAALFVVVLGIGVVAWIVTGVDVASLHAAIRRWGPWAPVLFVASYALITLTPIPKGVMSAAAGAAFGLPLAAALVYGAALLGAALAFVLGRLLGRDAVERLSGTRLKRADHLLARRGLRTVLAVRLVPLVPFTAINYAAGLSAVRRGDYALGTAVGIIPGTLGYVALGSGVASGHLQLVVVAATVLLLLSALAALVLLPQRRGRLPVEVRARPRLVRRVESTVSRDRPRLDD